MPADDSRARLRRAAVAVTLHERADGTHVLIIRRVGGGMNPGPWVLPGGRLDAGENSTKRRCASF